MVHFAIATIISSSEPSPTFLIGSIAPDAIHVKDKVTRKDKGYTHLISEGRFPSLEILKENCLIYLNRKPEDDWKDFVLGYFAHIYTDIRWTETAYMKFESEYRGNDQDKRKIYNLEVSQVEFELMKSEEWVQDVINKLQQASAYTIEPFVTQFEVSQYRDLKINWLQDHSNEPMINPNYFTVETVKEFILKTSEEISILFKDWGIEYLKEGKNIS